jgi:hypothetical protein
MSLSIHSGYKILAPVSGFNAYISLDAGTETMLLLLLSTMMMWALEGIYASKGTCQGFLFAEGILSSGAKDVL